MENIKNYILSMRKNGEYHDHEISAETASRFMEAYENGMACAVDDTIYPAKAFEGLKRMRIESEIAMLRDLDLMTHDPDPETMGEEYSKYAKQLNFKTYMKREEKDK